MTNVLTTAGGAYTIDLPTGSYELWIETNARRAIPTRPMCPDGTFANATVIDLTTTDQTDDIDLPTPPEP